MNNYDVCMLVVRGLGGGGGGCCGSALVYDRVFCFCSFLCCCMYHSSYLVSPSSHVTVEVLIQADQSKGRGRGDDEVNDEWLLE